MKTQLIAALRGLGPKSQAKLAKVGISSIGQLRKIGAVRAYLKVKHADKRASLNLLYGLVSAIEDRDWRDIKRERKLALLMAVEEQEHRH